MPPPKITEAIKSKALALLEENPEGLRYSQFRARISASDAAYKANTINASIWNTVICS